MTQKSNTNITYFHASNAVDFGFACKDLAKSNLPLEVKNAISYEMADISLYYNTNSDPNKEQHVFFFTDTADYHSHIDDFCELYNIEIYETSLIYADDNDYCWVREDFTSSNHSVNDNEMFRYGCIIVPLPKTYNYVADLLAETA